MISSSVQIYFYKKLYCITSLLHHTLCRVKQETYSIIIFEYKRPRVRIKLSQVKIQCSCIYLHTNNQPFIMYVHLVITSYSIWVYRLRWWPTYFKIFRLFHVSIFYSLSQYLEECDRFTTFSLTMCLFHPGHLWILSDFPEVNMGHMSRHGRKLKILYLKWPGAVSITSYSDFLIDPWQFW